MDSSETSSPGNCNPMTPLSEDVADSVDLDRGGVLRLAIGGGHGPYALRLPFELTDVGREALHGDLVNRLIAHADERPDVVVAPGRTKALQLGVEGLQLGLQRLCGHGDPATRPVDVLGVDPQLGHSASPPRFRAADAGHQPGERLTVSPHVLQAEVLYGLDPRGEVLLAGRTGPLASLGPYVVERGVDGGHHPLPQLERGRAHRLRPD